MYMNNNPLIIYLEKKYRFERTIRRVLFINGKLFPMCRKIQQKIIKLLCEFLLT